MTGLPRPIGIVSAVVLAAIVFVPYALSKLLIQEPIQLPTMRTHCIGRYLIDLPEEYTMTPGSNLELYYGLDVDFDTVQIRSNLLLGDRHEFDRRVRKIVANLEADEHFKSPSKNMLARVNKIDQDLILVQSYDSPRATDSFVLHLYAQRGEAIVRLENNKFSDEIDSRPLEYFESQLLRIAQNTHFFDAPEKAGKGSCLGSVTIDDKQDGEMFILAFLSKEHPDIILNISMNSLPEKGDGGLLKRADSKADMLRKYNPFST